MTDQFPDKEWDLKNENGNISWDKVPIAVLMDIRRELQRLNCLLGGGNE